MHEQDKALTLAVDCACGYTVLALGQGSEILCSASYNIKRQQAAMLPVITKQMLGAFGVDLNHIDRVAVTCGPGAYTGVRLGVVYACSLAFGIGVPVWPQNTLLAMGWDVNGAAAPYLHARAGYVYGAIYDARKHQALPPSYMAMADFCSAVRAASELGKVTTAGNRDLIGGEDTGSAMHVHRLHPPGENLILMGGNDTNPQNVSISYLREPDFGPPKCDKGL